MIRVLHVTYWGLFLGGGETTLMNFYRHIDRTKLQFDFLIFDGNEGKEYYEDEATALGANVYRRPPIKRNPIKGIFALYRIIKQNPDIKIVHINGASPISASIDSFFAKLAGISVRIIYSGTDIRYLKIKKHKPFRFLARMTATHYCAGSVEAGLSMFGEKARDKIIIIPRARSLEGFRYNPAIRGEIRKELALGGMFTIVTVGRMAEAKNTGFLLEVISCAGQSNLDLVLLLVGDGTQRDKLEKKAKDLQITEKVRFLGSRSDVPELLQAADIFMLPSLHEGFGGAALEAQAAGLPCLLSDRIPAGIKVTDLVEFLPIDKGPETWVTRMLAYRDFKRCDTIEEVRRAGYDICDAAKWLEELYINAVRESGNDK